MSQLGEENGHLLAFRKILQKVDLTSSAGGDSNKFLQSEQPQKLSVAIP